MSVVKSHSVRVVEFESYTIVEKLARKPTEGALGPNLRAKDADKLTVPDGL